MEYRPGEDIFDTDAECIINPVNCRVHLLEDSGRRQAGLAGAFEKRFPDIQPALVNACRKGQMKPGGVQLIRIDRATGRKSKEGDGFIANVATKDDWKDPSKLEWVDESLRKLAGALEARGVRSVAIPQLGAGLGKLEWAKVRKSVETHFGPAAARGMKVMVMGEGPDREATSPPAATAPRRVALEEDGQARYVAGIGARATPEPVLAKMEKASRLLAKEGCILRSGGAEGADARCEAGWDAAGGTKQIFLSWKGMNGRQPNGRDVFCFSYGDGVPEAEIAKSYYQRGAHVAGGNARAWAQLGRGGKAHMARNTNQVLGPNIGTSPQTNCILCWTEGGAIKGGTGQALRIAEDKGIAVVNLGDPALKSLKAEEIARLAQARMDGRSQDEALTSIRKARRDAQMER